MNISCFNKSQHNTEEESQTQYYPVALDERLLIWQDPSFKYYMDQEYFITFNTDAEGRIIRISPNIKEILHIKYTKILYNYLWSFNLVEQDSDVVKKWNTAHRDKTELIIKQRHIVNKKIKHLIIEAHPKYSSNNDFMGLSGIIINILPAHWREINLPK